MGSMPPRLQLPPPPLSPLPYSLLLAEFAIIVLVGGFLVGSGST